MASEDPRDEDTRVYAPENAPANSPGPDTGGSHESAAPEASIQEESQNRGTHSDASPSDHLSTDITISPSDPNAPVQQDSQSPPVKGPSLTELSEKGKPAKGRSDASSFHNLPRDLSSRPPSRPLSLISRTTSTTSRMGLGTDLFGGFDRLRDLVKAFRGEKKMREKLEAENVRIRIQLSDEKRRTELRQNAIKQLESQLKAEKRMKELRESVIKQLESQLSAEKRVKDIKESEIKQLERQRGHLQRANARRRWNQNVPSINPGEQHVALQLLERKDDETPTSETQEEIFESVMTKENHEVDILKTKLEFTEGENAILKAEFGRVQRDNEAYQEDLHRVEMLYEEASAKATEMREKNEELQEKYDELRRTHAAIINLDPAPYWDKASVASSHPASPKKPMPLIPSPNLGSRAGSEGTTGSRHGQRSASIPSRYSDDHLDIPPISRKDYDILLDHLVQRDINDTIFNNGMSALGTVTAATERAKAGIQQDARIIADFAQDAQDETSKSYTFFKVYDPTGDQSKDELFERAQRQKERWQDDERIAKSEQTEAARKVGDCGGDDDCEENLRKARQEIATLREQLSKQADCDSDCETQLEEARGRIEKLQKKLSNAESASRTSRERARYYMDKHDKAKTDLRKARDRLIAQKAATAECQKQLEFSTYTQEKWKAKAEEQRGEIASLERKVARSRGIYVDLLEKLAETERSSQKIAAELETLKAHVSEPRDEMDVLEGNLRRLMGEVKGINTELDSLRVRHERAGSMSLPSPGPIAQVHRARAADLESRIAELEKKKNKIDEAMSFNRERLKTLDSYKQEGQMQRGPREKQPKRSAIGSAMDWFTGDGKLAQATEAELDSKAREIAELKRKLAEAQRNVARFEESEEPDEMAIKREQAKALQSQQMLAEKQRLQKELDAKQKEMGQLEEREKQHMNEMNEKLNTIISMLRDGPGASVQETERLISAVQSQAVGSGSPGIQQADRVKMEAMGEGLASPLQQLEVLAAEKARNLKYLEDELARMKRNAQSVEELQKELVRLQEARGALGSHADLKTRVAEMTSQLESLREAKDKLEKLEALQQANADKHDMRARADYLREALSSGEEPGLDARKQIEKELKIILRDIKAKDAEIDKLNSDVASADEHNRPLVNERTLADMDNAIEQLEAQLDEAAASLQKSGRLNIGLDAVRERTELKLRKRIKDLEAERAITQTALEKDKEELHEQIQGIVSVAARLEDRLRDSEEQHIRREHALRKQTRKNDRLKERIEVLETELSATKEKLAEETNRGERDAVMIQELKAKCKELKSQIKKAREQLKEEKARVMEVLRQGELELANARNERIQLQRLLHMIEKQLKSTINQEGEARFNDPAGDDIITQLRELEGRISAWADGKEEAFRHLADQRDMVLRKEVEELRRQLRQREAQQAMHIGSRQLDDAKREITRLRLELLEAERNEKVLAKLREAAETRLDETSEELEQVLRDIDAYEVQTRRDFELVVEKHRLHVDDMDKMAKSISEELEGKKVTIERLQSEIGTRDVLLRVKEEELETLRSLTFETSAEEEEVEGIIRSLTAQLEVVTQERDMLQKSLANLRQDDSAETVRQRVIPRAGRLQDTERHSRVGAGSKNLTKLREEPASGPKGPPFEDEFDRLEKLLGAGRAGRHGQEGAGMKDLTKLGEETASGAEETPLGDEFDRLEKLLGAGRLTQEVDRRPQEAEAEEPKRQSNSTSEEDSEQRRQEEKNSRTKGQARRKTQRWNLRPPSGRTKRLRKMSQKKQRDPALRRELRRESKAWSKMVMAHEVMVAAHEAMVMEFRHRHRRRKMRLLRSDDDAETEASTSEARPDSEDDETRPRSDLRRWLEGGNTSSRGRQAGQRRNQHQYRHRHLQQRRWGAMVELPQVAGATVKSALASWFRLVLLGPAAVFQMLLAVAWLLRVFVFLGGTVVRRGPSGPLPRPQRAAWPAVTWWDVASVLVQVILLYLVGGVLVSYWVSKMLAELWMSANGVTGGLPADSIRMNHMSGVSLTWEEVGKMFDPSYSWDGKVVPV